MLELKWLGHLPESSLEGGIKFLNELKWNLLTKEIDGVWFVSAGHKVILKTASRESVDALLYGMALAYTVLPEVALKEFRRFIKESTG